MSIFVFFVSAGVLFDGGFSLWLSLNTLNNDTGERINKLFKQYFQNTSFPDKRFRKRTFIKNHNLQFYCTRKTSGQPNLWQSVFLHFKRFILTSFWEQTFSFAELMSCFAGDIDRVLYAALFSLKTILHETISILFQNYWKLDKMNPRFLKNF